jgi:pimeloyl-ACP methyl ester carboxylesterase
MMRSKSTAERTATPQNIWEADLKLILAQHRDTQLPNLKVPTLILWGEQDQVFVKEDQERLRASIQHAQFRSYPGAGHTVQWELPKEVAADIRKFVEEK